MKKIIAMLALVVLASLTFVGCNGRTLAWVPKTPKVPVVQGNPYDDPRSEQPGQEYHNPNAWVILAQTNTVDRTTVTTETNHLHQVIKGPNGGTAHPSIQAPVQMVPILRTNTTITTNYVPAGSPAVGVPLPRRSAVPVKPTSGYGPTGSYHLQPGQVQYGGAPYYGNQSFGNGNGPGGGYGGYRRY